LCCGEGVYSWLAVQTSAGNNTLEPTWRYEHEMTNIYANTIAQEVDDSGILIAGFAGKIFRLDLPFGLFPGKIFRLDLESGDMRCLLTIPGEDRIHKLAMSLDGQALGVISFSGSNERAWSVWSYPKLLLND
jgi:hypothetical protein